MLSPTMVPPSFLKALREIERHLGVFDVRRAQQIGVPISLAVGVFRLGGALNVVGDGVGEDEAVAGHGQGRRGRAGRDRRDLRGDDDLGAGMDHARIAGDEHQVDALVDQLLGDDRVLRVVRAVVAGLDLDLELAGDAAGGVHLVDGDGRPSMTGES